MGYRVAAPLIVVPLLLAVAQVNFLLFHTAAELFAAVVGLILFFVGAVTLRWARDSFFYALGAGYFWVAALDLLHTASYKGIGLLDGSSANPATQYWVLARLLEAAVLFLAPAAIGRRISPTGLFLALGAVVCGGLVAVESGILPAAYVDGVGLTPLKIGLEYGVIGLLILAWWRYQRRRAVLPKGLYRTLTWAIALTITAELAFTVYVDVYDLLNLTGHVFKVLSFWLLLLAATDQLVSVPFTDLSRSANTLNALDDPILLVERSGAVRHVNDAARKTFGLQGEPMPSSLHAIGPAADLPEATCPVCRSVREGRTLSGLQLRDSHTGLWYAADVRLAKTDEGRDGAVVRFLDITAMKRLERQVREEKLRADVALEATQLGIWDWNVTTGAVTLTDRILTMLGYEPGDWGHPVVDSWSSRVHPDDWPDVQAALEAHLADDNVPYCVDHRLRRKDGSYAWIRSVGRVVERSAEGAPLRVIGTHADVTSAVEMELSLQRSNHDLAQFAYAVSHDLQEPLRMITGFLGVVNRRYRDDLPEDGKEFVDRAVDGAMRMSAMIKDLLEVSRVQTKGAGFTDAPLAQPIGEAIDILAGRLEETGGEVGVDDGLPVVHGDQTQLIRLFQNLIGNALKYRRDGVAPQVRIVARPCGDMVEITVADNGPGIPESERERIFQPFQRLHAFETTGSGIGLTLCRRIVERHGGAIAAEGNRAGGATFRFTLPAGQPGTAPPPDRKSAPEDAVV